MKQFKPIIFAIMLALGVGMASAKLPAVQLKDLKGRTVNTATLSNGGKPMIISFFAGWCKPCKRELNAINEVYDDWVDETGVKLIAISIDKAQDVAKVKPMVDAEGWDYEILLDPNSDFMRAMGIQQIPHLLIIDGNGKIVESRSGYTDGAESHIIEKLREITAPKKKKK
ncbi:MAG: TlpA family protein disulfide reductase [Bacteroides sp.]|nr:TlpA family protein disulfide reductase [Bacteroides sp.]MCM1380068.1 TlpA family protein disulfide reductase [Bacteroides sp.]MCM1446405.1 TlpA family protein disulfide reductase [Prevotella sp.]